MDRSLSRDRSGGSGRRRAALALAVAVFWLATLAMPVEGSSAAVVPTATPGIGEVQATGDGTPVELIVPLTLDRSSSEPVTVAWTTLSIPTAPNTPIAQASPDHYTPSTGVVTFAPGQTVSEAVVPVTAGATYTSEYIVVSFHDPTGSRMGGFWGLGFGVVDPFGYDPTAWVGFSSPLSGQHPTEDGYPFTVGADIVLSHDPAPVPAFGGGRCPGVARSADGERRPFRRRPRPLGGAAVPVRSRAQRASSCA